MRNSNQQVLARVQRAQEATQQYRDSSLNKQIQFASRLEAGLQGVELYEDPILQVLLLISLFECFFFLNFLMSVVTFECFSIVDK